MITLTLTCDNLEPVFSLDDKESIHFVYERKKEGSLRQPKRTDTGEKRERRWCIVWEEGMVCHSPLDAGTIVLLLTQIPERHDPLHSFVKLSFKNTSCISPPLPFSLSHPTHSFSSRSLHLCNSIVPTDTAMLIKVKVRSHCVFIATRPTTTQMQVRHTTHCALPLSLVHLTHSPVLMHGFIVQTLTGKEIEIDVEPTDTVSLDIPNPHSRAYPHRAHHYGSPWT